MILHIAAAIISVLPIIVLLALQIEQHTFYGPDNADGENVIQRIEVHVFLQAFRRRIMIWKTSRDIIS
jgi:hypothetical protein